MCEHKSVKEVEKMELCNDCGVILDDLVFDDFVPTQKMPTRFRTYQKFLDTYPIPGPVRMALEDLFPVIETGFMDCNRKNFINLSQLTIEMLKLTGNAEYTSLFKPFKTPLRVKQVNEVVNKCVRAYFGEPRIGPPPPLDLIEIKGSDEVDMSKVPKGNHIYRSL